jgi:aminoglycoside phosphotransferase
MPLLHPITPETVASILRDTIGIIVAPEAIALEQSDGCRFARLSHGNLLFVAETPAGAARLARESKLLRALAKRVQFGLPRFHDFPDQGLQFRSPVPGAQLGGDGRERTFADSPQGERLARELGRTIGELHAAFSRAELEALGLAAAAPALPRPEALREGLTSRIEPEIAAICETLIRRYADIRPDEDVVFVHGDLWAGNIAVDLETGALNGLFDFEDAGLGDRHIDLMYLHSFGDGFADRAFQAYAQKTGRPISKARTALYHAIAAMTALAGTPERPDGQFLQQRRRWLRDVCEGPIARLALQDLR